MTANPPVKPRSTPIINRPELREPFICFFLKNKKRNVFFAVVFELLRPEDSNRLQRDD